MIDYSPFWNTLKSSQETTYTLINKHHISSSTIDKLRKNKPLNTTTLNDLAGFSIVKLMIFVGMYLLVKTNNYSI